MITLIATTKYGLEVIVKTELRQLGFDDINVQPGRVEFTATLADIPRVNLWLRCADRVRVKVGEFKATTFDDLFEQTKALAWESWIPKDGRFDVRGRSVRSELFSVRSCQAIVKKATAERLLAAHAVDELPEVAAEYTIEISLLRDVALLTIDTSGAGLHMRGYREEAGEAPLKETFAAGLVLLSYWNRDRLLVDPLCGSGTILIEAALIARNIAPGLKRDFASEAWPIIGDTVWREARREATSARQKRKGKVRLFGYDNDAQMIKLARRNASKAGVERDITFEQKEIEDLWIDQEHGVVITNPPYGVRMSDFREINLIYIALNKMFRKKLGWSVYVLTADEKFPDYFKRSEPDRVRKLYNGTLKTNYYQYHGEKPTN
jgi:putative N6-adenine-specific DNA methylase